MPIHEYYCLDCGKEFEEIVFRGEEQVACSACKSTWTRKLISRCRTRMGGDVPSAKETAAAAGGAGGGCASCGGGSCASC